MNNEKTTEYINKYVEKLEDYAKTHKRPSEGFSTGYDQLDHALGDLRPGEMTVICGEPGIGKTTLLVSMAVSLAFEQAKHIRIVPACGMGQEFIEKLIQNRANVPMIRDMERPYLSDETKRIVKTLAAFRKSAHVDIEECSPSYIDDAGLDWDNDDAPPIDVVLVDSQLNGIDNEEAHKKLLTWRRHAEKTGAHYIVVCTNAVMLGLDMPAMDAAMMYARNVIEMNRIVSVDSMFGGMTASPASPSASARPAPGKRRRSSGTSSRRRRSLKLNKREAKQ